tara:strand:+ start:19755 stop:20153 length:399 start_codon:yes stop_codon:yes gene_type:complete
VKGLDTNVLVRHLVQDDPKQSVIASRYIDQMCSIESPCLIGHITLCELSWVLESCYKQDRLAIASIIEQLLQVNELKILGADSVWLALSDYKKSNADFPDHLLARVNQESGCDATITFDRKAAKHSCFELLA